ncbi:MAG TPA: ABC transporter permease subunit [Chloroflexota bacterium]|nr:ABC transporter permease subunit [Chloroflexota bacterium]
MIDARGILFNSVVGKELRTRMRGWRSIAVVSAYMLVLGVIAISFLVQEAGPTAGQSSQIGVQLFQALAGVQLFLILFVTPASTAGAISGERQRQTWDLLLVTRLSTFGIVWGKLVAGLAFNVLLIFASLPLFSLVFLFGGVAPNDIVNLYIVFLATVLLLGTVSLFISALTRRLAAAMIISNVVALILGVGITLLAVYLENWGTQQYLPGPTGMQAVPSPPLTPLAQLDPFVALASALPNGSNSSFLGGLGMVHHAFGILGTLHLWAVYAICAVLISAALLALTTYFARHTPRWLVRDAA